MLGKRLEEGFACTEIKRWLPSRGYFGAPCVRQQRLQEELRELQIRLEGANMLAGQLEREVSDCQQR